MIRAQLQHLVKAVRNVKHHQEGLALHQGVDQFVRGNQGTNSMIVQCL